MSSTIAGECAVLLAANVWHAVRRPVYGSLIRPERFEIERERLWRHLHQLLPAAGYEVVEDGLAGKNVLLIGVGSTFAFALMLLALGARRVICIDPFLRDTDREAEERFTRFLLESIPWPATRRRADEHIARVRRHGSRHGFLVDGQDIQFFQVRLEEVGSPVDLEAPFDLILSNAVLEHLADINVAMKRFKALLSPNGGMAHAFGFMNHSLFAGSHSQAYLRFSPGMWRLMTSNSSPPNRCSLSHFRRATAAAGLDGASFTVLTRYSEEETRYALQHAHPAVVADNAADMSAEHTLVSVRARPGEQSPRRLEARSADVA